MPIRVALDSCVIIDGLVSEFSASKAVLILGLRKVIQLVIPQFVIAETERAIRKIVNNQREADILEAFQLLIRKLSPEIISLPTKKEMEAFRSVIRHQADVPVLASVVKCRPDYFLTTNISHFNKRVTQKTSLKILRPEDFLAELTVRMKGSVALNARKMESLDD